MINLRHIIQRITMLAVLVSMMVACTQSVLEMGDDAMSEQVNPKSGPKLVLRVTYGRIGNAARQFAPTRAVPNGGEDGDGREKGGEHENRIMNLCLYKFVGDINSSATTPVEKVTFVNHIEGETKTDNPDGSITYELPVYVDRAFTFSDSFYYIVALNTGDINVNTLGELRDKLVEYPWLMYGSTFMSGRGCFAMSNEGASHFLGGNGSEENPYVISTDVERVAARLDFCTNGSVISDGQLKFPVYTTSMSNTYADVFVSHVRGFNLMQKPTYLIKRISDSESGEKHYLIDEIAGARYQLGGDTKTMYVEEPHTWVKEAATTSDLRTWFGDTRYGVFSESQGATELWCTNTYKVHTGTGDAFTNGTSTDAWGNNFYVVDYTNENTMTPDGTHGNTATGIFLRAIYVPRVVYGSVDGDGLPVADDTYAKGKDFWRYLPFSTDVTEEQALYFSSLEAVNAYRTAHPEDIPIITHYYKGICYYVTYMRHDNTGHGDNIADIAPMEFGIVRNNIYRLRVGFNGPGYNVLPTEEKIEPEGIKPYIFVKKWNYIVHPEIEI